MKKVILALFILFTANTLKSQILTPVKWSYAFKKLAGNETMVYVKATIDKGWHLYSQTVKDGGPVKTTFTFPKSPAYLVVGKTIEPKPISKFEKTFDMDVAYFENTVMFSQKVKLKAKKAVVKGTVEFMVCDDTQCLPPQDINFSIAVK
jgi:hypothetical protein